MSESPNAAVDDHYFYAPINTSPAWDHEMWCAHGGHVHPEPGCPFCPEVTDER